MDNSKIIPSKIHLTNIKTEKENTILFDGKLAVKPTYDIKVAHSMMHNLEKELVKIRLFLDVNAVVDDIKERYRNWQPILVRTVAVETSAYRSELLHQAKVPHEVLNAKNHFNESEIILNAGQRGAVTIVTYMAGR